MKDAFKRRLFDRYDGWRVRKLDAFFLVVPFFLRTRIDSQIFADLPVDSKIIDDFVKKYRDEIPGLSVMHVLMAAMVRVISQRPYVNRFIVWNKIYARNDISISVVVKRSITDDGEETLIKSSFQPTDTIYEVVETFQKKFFELDQENGSDKTAKLLGSLPSFILRPLIGLLRCLDNIGKLPKAIHEVSPWHSSAFITNMASLRTDAIYHHLYEFGTCSLFAAMGLRRIVPTVDKDGNIVAKKMLGLKFVTDERICDGHYYAVSIRMLKKYLTNPEILLTPPEKVIMDDGVKI